MTSTNPTSSIVVMEDNVVPSLIEEEDEEEGVDKRRNGPRIHDHSSWGELLSYKRLPVTGGVKHLPKPMGPYSVGFVDWLTAGRHVGNGGESTFMRLFYPCRDANGATEEERMLNCCKKWPPLLNKEYTRASMAFHEFDYRNWPSWYSSKDYPFTIFTMYEMLSRYSDFFTSSLFYYPSQYMYPQPAVPIRERAPPLKLTGGEKFPLILFSHGHGMSRHMSSKICYDLTSMGFIVAAIEHRDGTASLSSYQVRVSGKYASDKKLNPSSQVRKDLKYMEVPGNAYEQLVRSSQLEKRMEEISHVLNHLTQLNESNEWKGLGVGVDGMKESLANVFYNQKGLSDIQEKGVIKGCPINDGHFKHLIDIDNIIFMGHSMGGATALYALEREARIRCAIALDPWLFPLKNHKVVATNKPLLVISSESFRSEENLEKLKQYKDVYTSSQFLYLKGAVHKTFTDQVLASMDSRFRSSWGLWSKINPVTAFQITNKVVYNFICKEIGQKRLETKSPFYNHETFEIEIEKMHTDYLEEETFSI